MPPARTIVASLLRPSGGTGIQRYCTGIQTHCNEFVAAVRAAGQEVELVTPFSGGAALRNGVFAVRIALEHLNGPASVAWYRHWHGIFLERVLRSRLAGAEPAILYCQCPVSAAAALRARAGPAQRVILAVHFNVSQADEWADKGAIARGDRVFRAIRQLESDVLKRVDGIVYVSSAARDELWTSPPNQVPSVVIPNFLFVKVCDDRTGGDGPVTVPDRDLVSVGSLEPRKNQGFLLDVLAAARNDGVRVTLDLIGHGPDRRILLAKARALGVSDQVRFLGYVADAAQHMRDYRLYVHAARQERFPMALLEAMASGLPMLAAPVGGIASIFSDDVEGCYWDLDDVRSAARLVEGLLEDPSRRDRLGAAGRRRCREHFDAATVVRELQDFLEGVAPVVREGAGQ